VVGVGLGDRESDSKSCVRMYLGVWVAYGILEAKLDGYGIHLFTTLNLQLLRLFLYVVSLKFIFLLVETRCELLFLSG